MIRKFVGGDYGLAKTYWFGLLALLGAGFAGFLVVLAGYEWDWVIHRAFRLECVYFVLLCVISVSIWHAAGKYTGQSGWALLAKATVVLLWIGEIGRGVYLLTILKGL